MSSRYIGGIVTKNPTALNPALGNAANGIFTMDQYVQQKAAGTWPAYDPYSKYTTLLLHGDGTNGGQNNTFLDSSTNNFTITRNGNTTQGSFSPYGSNWSNYFDGTNSKVTMASAASMSMTGQFTIECWVYWTGTTTLYQNFIGSNDTFTNNASFFRVWGSGGVGAGSVGIGNPTHDATSSVYVANGLTANTWTHVAATRDSSNIIRVFINGTLRATGSADTSTYDFGQGGTCIGDSPWDGANGWYSGYISNLRVVKGAALYTSSFTPSTTPLTTTVSAGTVSLLTCQSNRFLDNSSNAYTLTPAGNASIQHFCPFNPNVPYTVGMTGGSGYFDGSGDYLTIPDNAAWNMGSGDFTAEAWIYPTSFANEAMIMGQWSGDTGSTTLNWALMFSSGSTGYLRLITSSNGSSVLFDLSTSTFALTLNMWQHIAAVRSGSTFTIYVNGVSRATTTNASALYDATNNFTIGAESNTQSQYFAGYISNARVVKGTAVYTGAFTPPTSPVTAVSGTSLLFDCTNGSIYDNAMMIDLETVGNAQISTSVKKYGTGSLYFDGSGDALRGPANIPQAQFGTGDFTVECWLYQTATNTYPSIVEVGNHLAAGGILFIASNGSTITAYSASYGGFMGTATAPSLNTWNHIAWVRNNGTFKIYVNGVGNTGITATTNFNSSTTLTVGAEQSLSASYTYTGYIDDLRITKGYARYTANFTPPTSQLQDQ